MGIALGALSLVYTPVHAEHLKLGDEMPKPRGKTLLSTTCNILSMPFLPQIKISVYDAGDENPETVDIVIESDYGKSVEINGDNKTYSSISGSNKISAIKSKISGKVIEKILDENPQLKYIVNGCDVRRT